MKQHNIDKKRIAFPIHLFREGGASVVPDEIHIVPMGEWDHPMYGPMKIGQKEVAEFKHNFDNNVRLNLPITAGHDNGMSGGELPAIGWFKDIMERADGLWGVVEWTEKGMSLLKERAFKYFSPEFYEDYEDPETQKMFGHVLVGGALTNKPYFKELTPVVAFSEDNIFNQYKNNMLNIEEIVLKKVEDLTDEEKTFLKDNTDKLSDEQKATFASVLDVKEEAPKEEETKTEEAPKEETVEEPKEEVKTASEKKMVQISASELDALRRKANDGAKALELIEASERGEVVKKLIFSESNKDGKFLPKASDKLNSFISTLNKAQRENFSEVCKLIGKIDASIFDEVGNETSETASIAARIDSAVKKVMSEKKVDYSRALKIVASEQPELMKEYESSKNS